MGYDARTCNYNQCDNEIISGRSDKKYCSSECSRKRYRDSFKGKIAEMKYARTDKRKAVSKRYSLTKNGKLSRREIDIRYKNKYPEKVRAVWLARPLEKKICSMDECDAMGEKHHPDYSKPLSVEYLCKKHHTELHILSGDRGGELSQDFLINAVQ